MSTRHAGTHAKYTLLYAIFKQPCKYFTFSTYLHGRAELNTDKQWQTALS